jgi:hypothetical protein
MVNGDLTANLAGLEESKRSWASAKVEYLCIDFGSRFVTGVDNGLQTSNLRFGVNYHF